MAIYIRRREFLVTLGSAASWPLAARAQPPAMPVIGFSPDLTPGNATGTEGAMCFSHLEAPVRQR